MFHLVANENKIKKKIPNSHTDLSSFEFPWPRNWFWVTSNTYYVPSQQMDKESNFLNHFKILTNDLN